MPMACLMVLGCSSTNHEMGAENGVPVRSPARFTRLSLGVGALLVGAGAWLGGGGVRARRGGDRPTGDPGLDPIRRPGGRCGQQPGVQAVAQPRPIAWPRAGRRRRFGQGGGDGVDRRGGPQQPLGEPEARRPAGPVGLQGLVVGQGGGGPRIQRGVDDPRLDQHHLHPEGGQFDAHCVRGRLQGELGRRVEPAARQREAAHDAGDIHDATLSSLAHRGEERPGDGQGAEQVDLELGSGLGSETASTGPRTRIPAALITTSSPWLPVWSVICWWARRWRPGR